MEKIEAILRQLLLPAALETAVDYSESGDPFLELMQEIHFDDAEGEDLPSASTLVNELATAIRQLVDERVAELTDR